MTLSAPFPYFGGKKRWADHIWSKFGKADVYIEPFAGSLAVLLANPYPAKREVVCDKDGLICNFWRAITSDPEQTAHWADYPTIHQDLTARHKWLKQWAREHSSQLSENADYYDAKAAGWWVWGISLWIGGGWCSVGESDKRPITGGGGGHSSAGVSAQRTQIPHVGTDRLSGDGVSAQRNQIPMVRSDHRGGSPVSAQSMGKIPKVCKDVSAGAGVSAQRDNMPIYDKRPHVGSQVAPAAQGVSAVRINRPEITEWFQALADRLKRVIVLNRDWRSAVTSSVLADTPSGPGEKINRCIFLDPPYRTEKRSDTLYSSDIDGTSDDSAVQAYEWAVQHGEKYRIAYCSHEGDFQVPVGWDVMTQAFKGVRTNRDKSQDCIMFSPACEDRQPTLFADVEVQA